MSPRRTQWLDDRVQVLDPDAWRLRVAAGGSTRDWAYAELAVGHGFPARLVVPGRRGFWRVKWVVSIEVDRAPWWRRAPFPLT